MNTQYELKIMNLASSILNVFENEILALKSNSYELKKRIREINGNTVFPNEKVDVTAYSYFESLFEYCLEISNIQDLENIKIDDEDLNKSFDKIIKDNGLHQHGFTFGKIAKYAFTQYFIAFCVSNFNDKIFQDLSPEHKSYISMLIEKTKNVPAIPFNKGSKRYFNFLFLLIHDYGIEHVDEILDYHYNKNFKSTYFIEDLKIKIKLIPRILKDDLIEEKILEWIKATSNKTDQNIDFSNVVFDINPDTTNKDIVKKDKVEEKDDTVQTGLRQLFIVENWELYVDVLTEYKNPLLKKENNRYKFMGKKSGDRGVVASWFNYLKSEGKIAGKYAREEIAAILTNEIIDYSISPSKVEDESKSFTDIKQKLVNILNVSLSKNKPA